LFRDPALHKKSWQTLQLVNFLLVIAGFIQLLIWSDLSPWVKSGWDPHQGRLVSTWLDPNFFGAALAILLPVTLFNPYLKKDKKMIVILLSLIALVATQSRSTYLALVTALLILSPLIISFYSRLLTKQRPVTLLSIISLCILICIFVAVLLGPRLTSLVSNDPTVQLRLNNLSGAWLIITDHPLLGVGYNAYQFAALKVGLISDFQIHSRAGTDNSWLTIWSTTGLIGLILFLVPWLYLIHLLLRKLIVYNNPFAIVGMLGLVTLTIHSLFINSFLYSHLLILAIITISLSITSPQTYVRDYKTRS